MGQPYDSLEPAEQETVRERWDAEMTARIQALGDDPDFPGLGWFAVLDDAGRVVMCHN